MLTKVRLVCRVPARAREHSYVMRTGSPGHFKEELYREAHETSRQARHSPRCAGSSLRHRHPSTGSRSDGRDSVGPRCRGGSLHEWDGSRTTRLCLRTARHGGTAILNGTQPQHGGSSRARLRVRPWDSDDSDPGRHVHAAHAAAHARASVTGNSAGPGRRRIPIRGLPRSPRRPRHALWGPDLTPEKRTPQT